MSASSAALSRRVPTAQAWDESLSPPDVAQAIASAGMAHLPADLLRRHVEPYLLSTFDAQEKLPTAPRGTEPRRAAHTVLATSLSGYALVTGDGWHDPLPPGAVPEERRSPDALDRLQTLRADVIDKGQTIHISDATGILEHFTCEDRIHRTMPSRERAGPFPRLLRTSTAACPGRTADVVSPVEALARRPYARI